MPTLSPKNFQCQPGTTASGFLVTPSTAGSNAQIKNFSGINIHATASATLTAYKAGSATANTLFTIDLAVGEQFTRDILEVMTASQTIFLKSSVATSINVNGNYLEYDAS